MNIGFIGLGNMGVGMAANLLKAGHQLTVYNRTAAKARPLVEQGARLAQRVADACQGDVVFTMLADDAALESVAFSEDGLIKHLLKSSIHVCCSTISIDLSEKLADAHDNAGQRYISAPVFGRPQAAAEAKLFVVAAGPPDVVDQCMPLFDAIGQKTFRFGEKAPIANLVKIGTNFLIASVIESLGEAMALISKAGLDQQQYVDFLTTTLFAAPVYKTYGGLIAERKFRPASFAVPLGLKDIRLAQAAAENLRVPMPLASLLHDRLLTLLARDGESLDWTAMAQLAAQDSGQTV